MYKAFGPHHEKTCALADVKNSAALYILTIAAKNKSFLLSNSLFSVAMR